jgi:hypothetical protein
MDCRDLSRDHRRRRHDPGQRNALGADAVLQTASEAGADARRAGADRHQPRRCFIAANNTDARVEALEIVTSPSNGWVATRGKTAMVYFPNAGFKGTDAFELRLVRRTDTEAFLTTTINMKVKVD